MKARDWMLSNVHAQITFLLNIERSLDGNIVLQTTCLTSSDVYKNYSITYYHIYPKFWLRTWIFSLFFVVGWIYIWSELSLCRLLSRHCHSGKDEQHKNQQKNFWVGFCWNAAFMSGRADLCGTPTERLVNLLSRFLVRLLFLIDITL